MLPVEGYSNPLWLLLLIPFFWLNLFDPVITPKIISVVFALLAYAIFNHALQRHGVSFRIRFIVLLLLAFNTPFVIWMSSGLENPLYALLSVTLFAVIGRESTRRDICLLIGIITGALAITRPDGMLFIGLYPFWMWLNKQQIRSLQQQGYAYILGVGLTFGIYMLFRMAYFHDILPNTYYAKESVGLSYFLSVSLLIPIADFKLLDLFGSMFGVLRFWSLLIVTGMTLWLIARRQFDRKLWLVGCFLLWAFVIYMFLPFDWMGEYRFATLFYPFFYAFLLLLLEKALTTIPLKWSKRVSLFCHAFLILYSAAIFLPRSLTFAASPTVPFDRVAQNLGHQFNRYTEMLGLDTEDTSLLAPDLGGTLYYSHLRVYDLAGLTDYTIARHLYTDDKTTLHQYIFDTLQPTFINLRGNFVYHAQFENAPQFQRDYLELCSYTDEAVRRNFGIEMRAGYFMRRDAIHEGDQAMLEQIRQEIRC
jgi:hypothetical protein